MRRKGAIWILALFLASVGLGITWYKHVQYGFPLIRGEQSEVWTIEAEIQFDPGNGPVKVSLALPENPPGYFILDEHFASSGYGFSISEEGDQSRGIWTRQSASGRQQIFMRLMVVPERTETALLSKEEWPEPSPAPFLENGALHAAEAIIEKARERSATPDTLASELAKILLSTEENQNVGMLIGKAPSSEERAQLLVNLLSRAGVPARLVRGVNLHDGRRFQSIVTLVDVFSEGRWVVLDPTTGRLGIPKDFLIWQRGGPSLLDVEGGKNSQVRFSVIRDTRSTALIARQRMEDASTPLLDFSIYALPIGEQNVFRHLLLVPLGALVLVIMRNFVGISTAGTFMPILIALSFQETRLLPGILLFVLVVGLGLFIRFFLSELNLLLVPRISAVVIVVIILMAGLSILSVKLDLPHGLAVTFFPMIIIAWTIERLSIIWEEEGPRDAIMQGSGSLVVAALAYMVMGSEQLKHLIFTFPELLLVLLAIILLLGKYTGYRLSELWRFRSIGKD